MLLLLRATYIAILRPDIPLNFRRLESRSRSKGTTQSVSIVERVISRSRQGPPSPGLAEEERCRPRTESRREI